MYRWTAVIQALIIKYAAMFCNVNSVPNTFQVYINHNLITVICVIYCDDQSQTRQEALLLMM